MNYNFLTDRSQLVVLSNDVFSIPVVPSGVVQGTVLGPIFFIMFIDALFCELSHLIPKQLLAFANDLKFVTRVDDDSINSAQETTSQLFMSDRNPMQCHLALTKMLYCIMVPKTLSVNTSLSAL